MSSADSGNFSAKHPPNTKPEPALAEALKNKIRSGNISCAAAHKVAREIKLDPPTVGQAIDLLEARIEKCQLGLFGYQPQKKVVQPAVKISDKIKEAIESRLENGRLSCISAWQIADDLAVGKLEVASVCETLGIKIKPCQLGAF